MKISVDTKQRLTTALLFVLEFYKVLMGIFRRVCSFKMCRQHLLCSR